jgi:alkylated DNA repair dioxygenase AlkB
LLRQMCELLSARYDVGFDSVWVNLYRDGRDSVAWHGDRNRRVMARPMVATVSLGARRKFQLRPRGTSTIRHTLMPGVGDLLVMGGECQAEWEHTVPKSARVVGPRMSVTIRHSRPSATS